MAPDDKPAKPGPVVIRKGVVTPLPTSTEPAAPPADKPVHDPRPLWQRVADSRGGAGAPPGGGTSPGGTGRGPGSRGPRRSGPPGRDRGDRGGRRGDRERHDQEQRGGPPAEARHSMPTTEPPPAPELPVPDEGSFADLLAGSSAGPRRHWNVGEKVAAKIIQLGHDVAFLELGSGLADGMIDVTELRDADGNVTARVGDIVDGVVVKGGERGVIVSKGRSAAKHRDAEALVEAAQTGLPVDGVVKAVNKGGLEVEVMGQRAFCPISQVDLHFVQDPSVFVGQKLQFKVQRADGRDAVLSRRALLEEERAERARKTRAALAEGAVFDGVVTSVQDYGAFVDIGGVEGLVHVSELAWDRVSKPGDLLKAGDAVKVQVLRIEQDAKKGERIALSVRSLTPKPEPAASTEPPRPVTAPPPPPKVGDVVKAAVDKIESFGLFVRFPGGRGLVPASETGTDRGTDLRRAFKVGDPLECAVIALDEQGRYRLSLTEAARAAERREAQEYLARAAPKGGGKGFGTLGDLLRDKLKG